MPRATPTVSGTVPTTHSTGSATDTSQPPPQVSGAAVRTLAADLVTGSVRCLGCSRPGKLGILLGEHGTCSDCVASNVPQENCEGLERAGVGSGKSPHAAIL